MEGIKVIGKFPAGAVTPPPSKSIAHRAIICASLARGESIIRNVDLSDDISATLGGMSALGAAWRRDKDALVIRGIGGDTARNHGDKIIDCAESGSTLRFLLPIAAALGESRAFSGRGRLMRRPLAEYRRLLADFGASIEISGENTLKLSGKLKSGVYELPGDVSSQYISGLLFALPLLKGDSGIRLTTGLESAGYVDMTIDALSAFGVTVGKATDGAYFIKGGQTYRPAEFTVEADYSQAAFFLCAAALGNNVSVRGLNPHSLQGDRAILGILKDAGATIAQEGGALCVSARNLRAVEVDARDIPDIVPPVAALCCFCGGTSLIKNAGRLRMKESDRLSALAGELAALGAIIEEGDDYLRITGSRTLQGGRVKSHGDHRIAMALAVAAIGCAKPVTLEGSACVAKSYPGFWGDFEKEARGII